MTPEPNSKSDPGNQSSETRFCGECGHPILNSRECCPSIKGGWRMSESTVRWLVEALGDAGVVSIGPFPTDEAALKIAARLMDSHPHLGIGVRPLYATSYEGLDDALESVGGE